VTRVSAKDVTIGIDIGTTAVKAVAADEDGRVTARTRIPHPLRVPAPERLEHDADEAWRRARAVRHDADRVGDHSRVQAPGLWSLPHTAPGKFQIGGPSNAGGLFLSWVDRLVGEGNPAAPDPRRVPVWSPYIRGERVPFHDPDRRGVLDRLDPTHDSESLRRAAYEASGFVVRQLIELSGAPASRIVATGGGTRVGPWMQAIADATGLPVEVSAVLEGAALEAAFLGRMAAGLETSITDAARWASTERVVEPDPAWADPMEDRFARFLELAESTVVGHESRVDP
jgi:sugar (pentulose or hexulose) kinase